MAGVGEKQVRLLDPAPRVEALTVISQGHDDFKLTMS